MSLNLVEPCFLFTCKMRIGVPALRTEVMVLRSSVGFLEQNEPLPFRSSSSLWAPAAGSPTGGSRLFGKE